jgi:protein-disulfide isomerase
VRRVFELVSPAEVAANANAAMAAEAADGWADDGGGGGSQWTILDGGVSTEKSVTENGEWDAFDDMDWGDV